MDTGNKISARRFLLLLLGGLAIGGGLALAVLEGLGLIFTPEKVQVDPAAVGALQAGAPAPDFNLLTTSGDAVSLSGLAGKPALLNFWATWCLPCKEEMPLLERVFRQYGDKLSVVGINFDDTPAAVDAFAEAVGVSFPLPLDPGAKVQALYQIRGYPTTYIIDSEGTIVKVHIGLLTEKALLGYLDSLGIR